MSEKAAYGNLEIQFDFTDKAKPYEGKPISGSTYKSFVSAHVVSVEVTGITEPTQGPQGNMRTANFTAVYEQTPIGKVIEPDWKGQEVKYQLPFVLYDDGWRIVGF